MLPSRSFCFRWVRRSVGCREVGADRHGSRNPRGLLSWFLAAAGAPISVFRGRDSTPLAGPYRPGASRGFSALRPIVAGSPDMVLRRRCYGGGGAPDPVCCLAVFSPPSPLQDRRGSELSL
ncbi:hypothetical protein NDU88_002277 [Pleurodeles waltl]|uniref:Uncharacterized protein n=1 Tax=Pleurodeles waltl TaxID=8319 RepID=A0AAV7MQY3_PLEWA|nr:hypothetical protein NDU88_002277 [Pleurodeles waltl]